MKRILEDIVLCIAELCLMLGILTFFYIMVKGIEFAVKGHPSKVATIECPK